MRWRWSFVSGAGDVEGPVTSHEFRAEGTQHVFSTSRDNGHIHEYWWKSRPAHHGDLMHASGAPRGVGPIASHVVEDERTQHVFYQSSDQHIYELWWRGGEAANVGDLTRASGGPLATPDLGPLTTGSLASHVVTADNTQHVFYASGDGRVHELLWSGVARPIHRNLTQHTRGGPAPRATGPLTSHVVAADGTQHVFYVADGDVIELSWGPGQDPTPRNLTSQTPGAPSVAGVSPLTSHVVDTEGTQHVFYVSSDGHINELWWPGAERPHREDLTFQSGGSPVVSRHGPPTTFLKVPSHFLESERTQHVFFVASNPKFRLFEIWWSGGGPKGLENLHVRSGETFNHVGDYLCSHVDEANSQHVFFWSSGLDSTLMELWTEP